MLATHHWLIRHCLHYLKLDSLNIITFILRHFSNSNEIWCVIRYQIIINLSSDKKVEPEPREFLKCNYTGSEDIWARRFTQKDSKGPKRTNFLSCFYRKEFTDYLSFCQIYALRTLNKDISLCLCICRYYAKKYNVAQLLPREGHPF